MKGMLSCKYDETVRALDNVFASPMYFFYETFFQQQNIDLICDRLCISRLPADLDVRVNRGPLSAPPPEFVDEFGLTGKNKKAARFVFDRFENVPWVSTAYR